MATSGTISTTVFNTRKVIDHAFRACKVPVQTITGEKLQTARDDLYIILSSLMNKGVPLWCQTKSILGLNRGQQTLACPVGTIDVLNAAIREVTRLTGTYTSTSGTAANAFDEDIDTACTLLAVAGHITMQLSSEDLVTTVGILPNATGTWAFTLQYSDDGSTWTTFHTETAESAVDGQWLWYDFEGLAEHTYWRLQGGAATTLDVNELVWANAGREITMAPLNKDDYFSLPSKNTQGRPVQYWLDRQQSATSMMLWPAPDAASTFRQVVILAHRHVMDVGTLQQSLEVPQRWLEAIILLLAKKIAFTDPEVKPDVYKLVKEECMEAERLAWTEERSRSPSYWQPNIGVYTR